MRGSHGELSLERKMKSRVANRISRVSLRPDLRWIARDFRHVPCSIEHALDAGRMFNLRKGEEACRVADDDIGRGVACWRSSLLDHLERGVGLGRQEIDQVADSAPDPA